MEKALRSLTTHDHQYCTLIYQQRTNLIVIHVEELLYMHVAAEFCESGTTIFTRDVNESELERKQ